MKIDIIKELKNITRVVPSGSYHICNPPIYYTDIDFFVLHSMKVMSYLLNVGFTYKMDSSYTQDFISLRKGNINIIVVFSMTDLDNVELATDLCKLLNLQDKEHILAVFNTIRYGVVSTKKSIDLPTKNGDLK